MSPKTSILPRGTTQQTVFDVTHSIIAASPALTQLSGDVLYISVGMMKGQRLFVINR
jgi:hypothetical protein